VARSVSPGFTPTAAWQLLLCLGRHKELSDLLTRATRGLQCSATLQTLPCLLAVHMWTAFVVPGWCALGDQARMQSRNCHELGDVVELTAYSEACDAGRYEETLVMRLAQTLAEGQHSVVIIDAPLLQAARVHSVWATAKVCLSL
jgi:hypothetical protein